MTTSTQPITRLAVTNVRIRGLRTEAIAATIRERLLKLEGVKRVRMSITDQSARVEYEPSRLTPTHIGAAIGQMGYSFTVRTMLRTM